MDIKWAYLALLLALATTVIAQDDGDYMQEGELEVDLDDTLLTVITLPGDSQETLDDEDRSGPRPRPSDKCGKWSEWKKVKCWWPNQTFDSLPQECTSVNLPSKVPSYLQKFVGAKVKELYSLVVDQYSKRGSPPVCGYCTQSFQCRARNSTDDGEYQGRGRRGQCRTKEIRPLDAECNDSKACKISLINGWCPPPLFLHKERFRKINDMISNGDNEGALSELFSLQEQHDSEGGMRVRRQADYPEQQNGRMSFNSYGSYGPQQRQQQFHMDGGDYQSDRSPRANPFYGQTNSDYMSGPYDQQGYFDQGGYGGDMYNRQRDLPPMMSGRNSRDNNMGGNQRMNQYRSGYDQGMNGFDDSVRRGRNDYGSNNQYNSGYGSGMDNRWGYDNNMRQGGGYHSGMDRGSGQRMEGRQNPHMGGWMDYGSQGGDRQNRGDSRQFGPGGDFHGGNFGPSAGDRKHGGGHDMFPPKPDQGHHGKSDKHKKTDFLGGLLHGTNCASTGKECLCCCGGFIPDIDSGDCKDLRQMVPAIDRVFAKLMKQGDPQPVERSTNKPSPPQNNDNQMRIPGLRATVSV